MNDLTFFATTPRGLTDLLAHELRQLGAPNVMEDRGGVSFAGDLEMAYRACLWSRLANRILLPLGHFAADTPEALYAAVREIDWSLHLSAEQTLAVDANLSQSQLRHSHYAALKIKDAIVDGFTEAGGIRPSVQLDKPDIRVNCYILRDKALLYLDLSGSSLHQRNYRLSAGQAPLKENLAAALLLRSRWPAIASSGGAFIDPMCGSGTLVIEAALLAGDIAPGLNRDFFGFMGWRQHQPHVWQALLDDARLRRDKGLERLPILLGFDSDRRVLEQAKQNAQRAGLAGRVSFAFQDLREFRQDLPQTGLMLTNPPYGRRMAESGELPALYATLGRVLKRHMRGWHAGVFTEDSNLGKHLGMRAERLHSLYNGAIACKLIHFRIDEDTFYRDARLPRRLPADQWSESSQMFRNRLQKNMKNMARWAKRESISCYRVYDADLPDYAAAIDCYQSAEQPTEHWVCIQEYAAPVSIDPSKSETRTRELVSITAAAFDVDDDHLFYKMRERKRGDSQYERADHTGKLYQVVEGAGRFWVNFEDYLDTGLFLDHRPIRARLAAAAAGKDFLNLFAYTGAATVHAALGGAASTTSVDMSRTYLDWLSKNLALNELAGERHQVIQADCLQWLKYNKRQYDLIFVDPPSFSNSKRMQSAFDVQADHADLIRKTMRLLRPQGELYFSTNLRTFKLDGQLEQDFAFEDLSFKSIPQDFKRRLDVHRCFRFTTSAGSTKSEH